MSEERQAALNQIDQLRENLKTSSYVYCRRSGQGDFAMSTEEIDIVLAGLDALKQNLASPADAPNPPQADLPADRTPAAAPPVDNAHVAPGATPFTPAEVEANKAPTPATSPSTAQGSTEP